MLEGARSEMSDANEPKTPYHYIVVRADLPIGKQMVHVAHAAGESVIEAPLSELTHVVLLHAKDEAQLIEYAEKVKAAGFDATLIHEPEGPEYGRGNVSLGVAPSFRHNKLRKLFHHLPLATFC